jgi:hypothetical protein
MTNGVSARGIAPVYWPSATSPARTTSSIALVMSSNARSRCRSNWCCVRDSPACLRGLDQRERFLECRERFVEPRVVRLNGRDQVPER